MSISRRTALTTGAAAVVTGAATAPLAIKTAGVKAALADNYAELEALRLAWRAAEQRSFDADDAEEEAEGSAGQHFARRLQETERRQASAAYELFMDTPATSMRGVLAKLTCLETEQEWAKLEQEFNLDSIMICAVRRDLERLAGEVRS